MRGKGALGLFQVRSFHSHRSPRIAAFSSPTEAQSRLREAGKPSKSHSALWVRTGTQTLSGCPRRPRPSHQAKDKPQPLGASA